MTKAEHLRLVAFRSKFLEHAKRSGNFGAGRIRDYLKRFHDIRIAGQTVQNILRKHGLGRLPANQKHKPHGKRWQRYEKPQPGHRLQMDVKFLERIPGTKKRLYQFTAIDDCTRIRVLKIYDTCNQGTAVAFANEVIRRLPFRIHVVQPDNGAEFQSHFHWHLEQLDIRHVYIKPWTPRLNGKVERSHRVDNEEFYQLLDKGGVSDDIHLFNKKLREWENYYNHHRPHGALGGKTPFERFLERAKVKVSRGSVLPTTSAASGTARRRQARDGATRIAARRAGPLPRPGHAHRGTPSTFAATR